MARHGGLVAMPSAKRLCCTARAIFVAVDQARVTTIKASGPVAGVAQNSKTIAFDQTL